MAEHRECYAVLGTGTGSEVISVERTEKPALFRATTRDGRCDNIDLKTLYQLPQGRARYATLLAKELVAKKAVSHNCGQMNGAKCHLKAQFWAPCGLKRSAMGLEEQATKSATCHPYGSA